MHPETDLREERGGAGHEVTEPPPVSAAEAAQVIENLRRELRDSGLRLAAVTAENEFLVENTARLQADVARLTELARGQRADLDEAHAFIRHCEETIANCDRELAKSPFHKAKRFTAALLRRFGLLHRGEGRAKTTAAASAPDARKKVREG